MVHDYRVVKGNSEFEAQRARVAAHLNYDVCMDNILLLMITALTRINRGELLSAHAFVAMSADMILSLEKRSIPRKPTRTCSVHDEARRRTAWRSRAPCMGLYLFRRIAGSSDWANIFGRNTDSR